MLIRVYAFTHLLDDIIITFSEYEPPSRAHPHSAPRLAR